MRPKQVYLGRPEWVGGPSRAMLGTTRGQRLTAGTEGAGKNRKSRWKLHCSVTARRLESMTWFSMLWHVLFYIICFDMSVVLLINWLSFCLSTWALWNTLARHLGEKFHFSSTLWTFDFDKSTLCRSGTLALPGESPRLQDVARRSATLEITFYSLILLLGTYIGKWFRFI